MSYSFVLTDLAGREVSELAGASAKRAAIPIVGMGTSSVTLRGDHEDADYLLEGDALLRVYEVDDLTATRTLIAHHDLVGAEEVASEAAVTVAATFADPVWTLMRRLCGKSPGGYTRGSSIAQVDRGTIIAELVAATNAENVSGVRVGTLAPSSDTYVAGWFYKKIGLAIAELGATLDGPDWRVRPIEYDNGYIGELDVLPSIGQIQSNAVFEYGDGALNVTSYRRVVTKENTANRLFSLPAGFPDNAVGIPLQREDLASQSARRLLEDVVPSDLTVDELRASLLDAHITARGGPTQTITFTPVRALTSGRVPRLGVDFNVGDVLPFRATVTRRGTLVKRLNILARLYSYEVTIDEQGAGSAALTVTPS